MNKRESIQHKILGKPLEYFAMLESTNKTAKELAERGAQEGTIVQADRQSLGRGRMDRVWESPPGSGLWFSIILRPEIDPQFGAQITLLTAVAVVEALKCATDMDCRIKWPNDIMVDGKKICGILSEMSMDENGIAYIVVGIGLNVNLTEDDFGAELARNATSAYLQTGRRWDRNAILQTFRKCFEEWYELWWQYGFVRVREMWLKHNCTIGKIVKVKDDDMVIFEGTANNITETGSLLVQAVDGTLQEFNFGEISIRF